MQMAQSFQNMFWHESIWLPPRVSWKDLRPEVGTFIPSAWDLWAIIPFAALMCLARFSWQEYLAKPIGLYFQLKQVGPQKPKHNEALENAFQTSRHLPQHEAVVQLSKKLDWTPRQVERWWRKRRVAGRPSQLYKMTETSWRGFYYFASFCLGMCILWDKPWFWDTKQCWQGYPRQHVTTGVWFYYMISMGTYVSHVIYAAWDAKRKDFVVHLIHHFVALLLLTLSYTTNLVRIGALVLCTHDFADYWLKAAKMAHILKYRALSVVIYDLFTLFWFMSRLGYYPFKLIRSILFEAFEEGAFDAGFPVYYVFVTGLVLLVVLHVIWSYFILQMFFTFILQGREAKDDRSESEGSSASQDRSESETESDTKYIKVKNGLSNGHVPA